MTCQGGFIDFQTSGWTPEQVDRSTFQVAYSYFLGLTLIGGSAYILYLLSHLKSWQHYVCPAKKSAKASHFCKPKDASTRYCLACKTYITYIRSIDQKREAISSSFMPGTGGGVDDGSGYSYLLNTKIAAFCNLSAVLRCLGTCQLTLACWRQNLRAFLRWSMGSSLPSFQWNWGTESVSKMEAVLAEKEKATWQELAIFEMLLSTSVDGRNPAPFQ